MTTNPTQQVLTGALLTLSPDNLINIEFVPQPLDKQDNEQRAQQIHKAVKQILDADMDSYYKLLIILPASKPDPRTISRTIKQLYRELLVCDHLAKIAIISKWLFDKVFISVLSASAKHPEKIRVFTHLIDAENWLKPDPISDDPLPDDKHDLTIQPSISTDG